MSIDETLNGTLEAQLREAMAKLTAACPPDHYAELSLRIKSNAPGWAGAYIIANSSHETLAGTCRDTISQAVDEAIDIAKSPDRIQKIREDLEQKVRSLQKQLDALPLTIGPTIVRSEAAA